MTKRAMMTGISGFAGGFLAERLLHWRGGVWGFSPNGRWLPTSPKAIQDKVKLSTWDFSLPNEEGGSEEGGREEGGSEEAVWREVERFEPEVIYHLAAMSVPSDCGESEPNEAAVAINVEGTRRVVEAILSAAPKARLVFISSSHVYAPIDPTSPQVTESYPVKPIHGYGKTKLAAEQVILDAVQRRGLDAVIARAFQHTGPRQTGRMMLPEWMKQIVHAEEGPIQIHTRDARIDLLDVRDVVQAYESIAESGQCGAVYNVGSGRVCRTGDLIDRLLEMAEVDREVVETRPGMKQDPVADITRLREDTGWEPLLSIDRTLSDTLAWWRKNGIIG